MKGTAKHIFTGGLLVGLLLLTTACAQLGQGLDVIGKGSLSAFEALLQAAPMEEAGAGAWALAAPDGSARFQWKVDWSGAQDAALSFDAAPFLAAGLDPAKLPDTYAYDGETLVVGRDLGSNARQPATALEAYAQIVKLAPDAIGYHSDMDHYGVNLGNGNLFEWAKDMAGNDKDMVFALDPAALIAAGVDPNAVEGWVFAKVPMHEGGKTVEVDKLLKPFNVA